MEEEIWWDQHPPSPSPLPEPCAVPEGSETHLLQQHRGPPTSGPLWLNLNLTAELAEAPVSAPSAPLATQRQSAHLSD
ncbi:hypothetical protein DPEC_G00063800 [Dallia pectoralis]|uniref:Uncharacterized protein n=1 Tax=Dallia pectoralis TaxID=75939 RepID=A0ACC2H8E4_DALPE|nr:hypothetical protein DPEC_G00063800 [Dallia pectoralis]